MKISTIIIAGLLVILMPVSGLCQICSPKPLVDEMICGSISFQSVKNSEILSPDRENYFYYEISSDINFSTITFLITSGTAEDQWVNISVYNNLGILVDSFMKLKLYRNAGAPSSISATAYIGRVVKLRQGQYYFGFSSLARNESDAIKPGMDKTLHYSGLYVQLCNLPTLNKRKKVFITHGISYDRIKSEFPASIPVNYDLISLEPSSTVTLNQWATCIAFNTPLIELE